MATSKTKAAQKAKKASAAKKKATPAKKKASSKAKSGLAFITEDVQEMMEVFMDNVSVDSTLTQSERRRLVSAGVKNYGLIDKAYDIARDNPKFLPSYIDAQEIWQDMHDFEEMRQLVLVLEKFLQLANESMLVRGNKCFHDALRVYGALKEMTKSRVPGAKPLFDSLQTFFRRRKKQGEEDTTIKKLDKDYHGLIHGTRSGKIVVEAEKPHLVGGKRVIVDKTRSNNDSSFKETDEGEAV
jgi:hypothetical protein